METRSSIRVLCIDDHPLIRDGISHSLAGTQDLVLVGSAASGLEGLDAYRKNRPDVTLVDLRLPDIDGVEVIQRIREQNSHARCIILTTFAGDVQAARALKAGAVGYLLKSTLDSELIDAIRRVHAGHRSIPKEIAAKLAEHFHQDDLSTRELEVLKVVAEGNSNKIVADRLNISEETVKGHMKTILTKLNANDRTHAAMIAQKRGFFDI
jgi:DNA-binding NarL/FixJ family response regulator